jgi:hypothetical protein
MLRFTGLVQDAASFMQTVRGGALALLAMTCWIGSTLAAPPEGQKAQNFDPVALAQRQAGEIAREITASRRDDPSRPEPSQSEVFNVGLLLQAGARALLPVTAREDVALPGSPSPEDPKPLVEAPENYKAVFRSGTEATPAQRAAALKAIGAAAEQLSHEGYTEFSRRISEWIKTQ